MWCVGIWRVVAPSDEVGEQGHLHEHFSQLTPTLGVCAFSGWWGTLLAEQGRVECGQREDAPAGMWSTLSQVRVSSKSPTTLHGARQARRPERHQMGRTGLVEQPERSLSVVMPAACSRALSTLMILASTAN